MIDAILLFIRSKLNDHLQRLTDDGAGPGLEDKVVFLDGERVDPVPFKLGAVTALLINIEEEAISREANPYIRVLADGSVARVKPSIYLNLCVLFVARFKQYEDSLRYLSHIIRYFQAQRSFDRNSAPDLDPAVEALTIELITLPFAEQNDLWNALRSTYHPSVVYRVRMAVFEDTEAVAAPLVTTEPDLVIQHTEVQHAAGAVV